MSESGSGVAGLARAAVIGLGSMGSGMAQSLQRAGFAVAGFDVGADAMARFAAQGGRAAASAAASAEGADIIVSVVLNGAQTEAVLFGPAGVADTMPAGSVFISSATLEPDQARDLATRLEAKGRHYLDAPISGGAARAAEGALTILASGSPDAFAKARPALDAMAAKLYELGDEAGLGAAFKMVNQHLAGDSHRRRQRGDGLRGQAGPRLAQGVRGHHRVRRQFVDVREPHAARSRRGLCAA